MRVVDTGMSKRRLKKHIQKLSRKGLFKCGIEARFFNINGVGIKLYDEEDASEYAFEQQSLAADHSLGPQVFEKINVSGVGFGFITEIAETDDIEDYWEEFSEDHEMLEEALADIGIYHGDLHYQNVGIIDGEIVCIDFGPVST
jgi:hypothetical protein